MPRDDRFRSILVLGSGPIVIGQACEFDYSGTQAVKALAAEGYRVILVNSNPATIMTDPDLLAEFDGQGNGSAPGTHRTYIEPLTLASLEKIIEREKPDAILPTVGGQTAINLTLELAEAGLLERHRIRLLEAHELGLLFEVFNLQRLVQIAAELDCNRHTVALWRDRYFRHGLAGLQDAPRSGRPRRFSPLGTC